MKGIGSNFRLLNVNGALVLLHARLISQRRGAYAPKTGSGLTAWQHDRPSLSVGAAVTVTIEALTLNASALPYAALYSNALSYSPRMSLEASITCKVTSAVKS